MKLAGFFPVAVILSSLALGCGDGNGLNGPRDGDDGDGPFIADFVGTWIALSVVFTNQADQSQAVDPIEQGGTATLTISANGRYTLVENFPGKPTITSMGSLHFDEGFLIVVDDEVPDDPLRFLFTKNDDLLTLQGEPGASEFDFDNDGILEPASSFWTFERQ